VVKRLASPISSKMALESAFAVQYARKDGLEVVAECDYANRFLNRDVTASSIGNTSAKSDGGN